MFPNWVNPKTLRICVQVPNQQLQAVWLGIEFACSTDCNAPAQSVLSLTMSWQEVHRLMGQAEAEAAPDP